MSAEYRHSGVLCACRCSVCVRWYYAKSTCKCKFRYSKVKEQIVFALRWALPFRLACHYIIIGILQSQQKVEKNLNFSELYSKTQ